MNHLAFRDPKFVATSAFGGLWATAGGLTTSQSSATGLPSINITKVFSPQVPAGTPADNPRRYQGVKVDIPVRVVQLDSGQQLTVGLKIQHSSASGGTYADLGDTGYTNTVIKNSGTATGLAVVGSASVSRSLVGAKKFIKIAARRLGSAADTAGDISASAFTVNFFGEDLQT